jgi:hypothetical protein
MTLAQRYNKHAAACHYRSCRQTKASTRFDRHVLLSQPSLINARKRSVIPVVLQWQALADGLSRYLSQHGLERRRVFGGL